MRAPEKGGGGGGTALKGKGVEWPNGIGGPNCFAAAPDDRPFNKAQLTTRHAPVKHSGKFYFATSDTATDARA